MAGAIAKRGRPARFNEVVGNAIVNLIEQGKTQAEIAELLGINEKTICLWKGKHPDLRLAINEARELPNELVEIAMFQNACGWSHEEEIAFFDKDSGQIVKDKIVKKFQPSDRAGIFWLTNCSPDRWNRDVEKPDTNSLNMLQLIINQAVASNPDNNRIISNVIGNEAPKEGEESSDNNQGDLSEAGQASEVGEE